MSESRETVPAQGAGEGEPKPANPSAPAASATTINLLGLGLMVLGALLVYLFLCLWPGDLAKGADANKVQEIMHLWGQRVFFKVSLDARLIMTVMVAGALGSFVHVATSFSDFVGNEKLSDNWIWWYILRPFVAMALAAILYFVVRGGFLSAGATAESLNMYGIAAISGIVGMFSKQATDKLGEVFDTLFKTGPSGGDSQRKDSLDNPIPLLVSAELVAQGSSDQNRSVTLKGSGFVRGSVVRVNAANRDTAFTEASQIAAKLVPQDLVMGGQLELTVFNPPPGGGVSPILKLPIVAPQNASNIAALGAVSIGADAESNVDGCDVEITEITPDDQLPAARGGVA